MTRVLFLTESFHPVLGGGEGHVRDLSRRLAASGMPATVVTRRGDRAWPARETMDGVRIVRVPPAGPGRSGKYAMVPAALLALPHVRAVAELEGFVGAYKHVAGETRVRGNLVPDAHVAAILFQHGVRTLYSNDRDFRKFPSLEVRDPFS